MVAVMMVRIVIIATMRMVTTVISIMKNAYYNV